MKDGARRTECQFIAIAQSALASDAFAIDESPVETAQILQDVLVAQLNDDAMFLRHNLVEELNAVAGVPPQGVARGESHRLLTLRSSQHQARHQACRLLVTVPNDKRCDI